MKSFDNLNFRISENLTDLLHIQLGPETLRNIPIRAPPEVLSADRFG